MAIGRTPRKREPRPTEQDAVDAAAEALAQLKIDQKHKQAEENVNEGAFVVGCIRLYLGAHVPQPLRSPSIAKERMDPLAVLVGKVFELAGTILAERGPSMSPSKR